METPKFQNTVNNWSCDGSSADCVTKYEGEKNALSDRVPTIYSVAEIKQEIDIETFSYKCNNCDYSTKLFRSFQVHIDKCDIVNKPALKNENEPDLLRNAFQLSIQQYQNIKCRCQICDKTFKNTEELKIHKCTHSEPRLYACDICGKRFTQIGNVHTHKRVHTKEKPYQCDICPKAFSQTGNLQTHKRIHNGEKPYKCEVCTKAFTQFGNLQAHKRIHSKEKPYACQICPETFRQLSGLQRHMKSHKDSKNVPCPNSKDP